MRRKQVGEDCSAVTSESLPWWEWGKVVVEVQEQDRERWTRVARVGWPIDAVPRALIGEASVAQLSVLTRVDPLRGA